MACLICLPSCGRCKPATIRTGTCPECNQIYYVDVKSILEGNPVMCERCGLDLTELARPVPSYCDYSGNICGVPCGRAHVDAVTEFHECSHWTPV